MSWRVACRVLTGCFVHTQVVIFVKSVMRAKELNKLLVECNFPSICIHSAQKQEERYASPHNPLMFHPLTGDVAYVSSLLTSALSTMWKFATSMDCLIRE